jgi:hypothetical protein
LLFNNARPIVSYEEKDKRQKPKKSIKKQNADFFNHAVFKQFLPKVNTLYKGRKQCHK